MNVPGYRLGIDFGTSNTVAMLAWPDGQVRPLLFDGSPALPSAVYADPNSGLLIGRDAAHAARVSPERYEPNPKRRIDEPAVLLGDAEFSTVDLIAAVLRRVGAEAQRVAGAPVGAATITFPAAWAQTRRGILVAAAERAGLGRSSSGQVSLVPEPVAAASVFVGLSGAARPRGQEGDAFVVYDLGAGTFDATVVRRTPNGGFDVLATEGLPQSGGLDIDAAIVGYLGAVYSTRNPELWTRLQRPTSSADRRANRLLWEDVRAAKEMLSRASSTMIHIPLADEDAPLGRDQFEQLARPILDATVNATRAAIASAGLGLAGVNGIFLVGGGSRIPLVATLLHQALGVAPTVVEQPELVVAQGSLGAGGSAGAGGGSGVGGPVAPVSGAGPAAPVSGGFAGVGPVSGAGPVAPVSGTASVSGPVSGVPAGPFGTRPTGYGASGPVSAPPGVYGSASVSAPPGPVSGSSGPSGPVSGPPEPPGSVPGAPGVYGASGPVSGPPRQPPQPPAWAAAPGRAAMPLQQGPQGQQYGAAPRQGRSRTGLIVAIVAVAVLVLGSIGYGISQIGNDDSDNPSSSSGDSGDSGNSDSGDTSSSDSGGNSGTNGGRSRPSADYYKEDADWTTTAQEYDDQIGSTVAFKCPANGTPNQVWGSEPFTSDSSVCTAAVHAGWFGLQDGGWVKLQMQNGVQAYQGSTQYGITTTEYGPFATAFTFIE